jgi:hypothetical protein
MFKDNSLVVADDPTEADFVIGTERSRCAAGGRVIDEVRRFDRTFARTMEQWNTQGARSGFSPT